MATVRSDHLPTNLLVALLIQFLGQGADVSLLTLDLGLKLGEGGGHFVQLVTKGILRALSLELLSLQSMGDTNYLGVSSNKGAGIDVAWCGISTLGNAVAGPPRYRWKGGKRCRHTKVFRKSCDVFYSR